MVYSGIRERKKASLYREILHNTIILKLPATAGTTSNVICGIMHPVSLRMVGYLIGVKNYMEVIVGQLEVGHGMMIFL